MRFGDRIITKLANGGDNRINIGSCEVAGETYFTIYAVDLLNGYHSYEQVILMILLALYR